MKALHNGSLLAVALATVGTASAEAYVGSGWLDVPSAAWFSEYSSVLMGEGYFNYQGGDTTFAGSFAVNPSGTRKVATVAVPDGSTLTLAAGGEIVKSGALIKTGKGTLSFKGDKVSFKNSTSPSSDKAPAALAWDASTGTLTSGYLSQGLNIHEGTVAITNATIDFGSYLTVGAMGSANDATLKIEDSQISSISTLSIGSCATNQTSASPTSRLIARNSVFNSINYIKVSRPSTTTYPKGQDLRSEILFDNCVVTNTGAFQMDPNAEDVTSHTTITLDNGTKFVNKYDDGVGITAGANVSATYTKLNILGNSTLLTDSFGIDTFWKQNAASNVVTIGTGSTLGFSRTLSDHNAPRWSWLHFDGGSLRPWNKFEYDAGYSKCASMLFHRWDNAYVLSGGGMLYAPPHFYAYLFPALFQYPGSTGGKISVTGGGTFAISPTDVPITVKDNSTLVFTPRHFLNEDFGLTMNGDHLDYDPLIRNSSITVEPGSSIRVRGMNQALMDMTLPATDISFSADGGNEALSSRFGIGRRKWVQSDYTTRLYDGDGSMTVMNGTTKGNDGPANIANADPIDLTRSFRITLEYSNAAFCGRVVKGVVAYIHNDSRGPAATGSGNWGLSYTTNTTSSTKIDKSVGVMLRTWNEPRGLYFCKNGIADSSTYQTLPGDINYEMQPDRIRPLVFTLSYDAAAKKFSYAVTSPYGSIYGGPNKATHDYAVANEVSVDLSQVCGAQGYFGFSAGADGGSPIQHQIANVSIKYLDELTRPCVDVAGNLNIGSGTANLSTYGTDTTAGYAIRELKFADGATINVASTNLAAGVEDPSFVAFDRWTGSGTVTKTGSGNLGMRIQSATDATLNLADGGLVLRKDYEDPYVFDGNSRTNRDWVGVQWAGYDNNVGYYRDIAIYEGSDTVYCGSGDTGRNGSTALKRLLKVSGKWTMSFDYESQQNDGAYGTFLTFHNDPRGYAACSEWGVAKEDYGALYALMHKDDSTKNIKNCASIHFYNYAVNDTYTNENHKILWWQSDAKGSFSDKGTVLSKTEPDSTGNEQIYIANYTIQGLKPKVARKFHCEITSDDSADLPLTITLTQTQGADGKEGAERKWTKSFAKNIPAIVGGDLCNFGLFFSSGGQTTRVKIKNFAFRHSDATESATKPYFGEVNVTAPNATVYLDGDKAYTYKLAKTVNVGSSLTVKSLRKAGTLDLGETAIPAKTMLAADGATIRLASADAINPAALLAVRNGGKLNLDFDGVARLNKIEIDGQIVKRGTFSAANTPSITGSGELVVGKGFYLILK